MTTPAHEAPDAFAVFERNEDELRSQLLTPDGLDALPPPAPLIEGLLFRNSLAALYGLPGAAKSFLAMDWALSVASGAWWHGRKVSQGPVLYVAAEGAAGLAQRKRAWEAARNVRASAHPITWLPRSVDLSDETWWGPLVMIARELGAVFVIIDTLSRSMPGADENAAKDMTRIVDALDMLRQTTGATVLVVHHSTKAGGVLRGHSALLGAVDTAIESKCGDGRLVTVACDKQKDAEQFPTIYLRLVPNGSSVTLETRGGDDEEDDGHSIEIARRAAWLHCGTDGLSPKELIDVSELPRRTFFRAKKVLVERGDWVNVGTDKRPRYLPAAHEPRVPS